MNGSRLLALTVLVAPMFAGCGGYGVSSSDPLGTAAKLEARLSGSMGMVKKPVADMSRRPELAGCASATDYHDAGAEEKSGDFQLFITLGLDAGGKVKTIFAVNLKPNDQDPMGHVGSNKIRGFCTDLWKAYGGGEAKFTFVSEGRSNQYDQAKFSSGKVDGDWRLPNGDPVETVTFTAQ